MLLTLSRTRFCTTTAFERTGAIDMISMTSGEVKVSSKLCCELGLMENAWSNRGNDANVPHANTAILGSREPAFPSRWLPQSTAPHSELQSLSICGDHGDWQPLCLHWHMNCSLLHIIFLFSRPLLQGVCMAPSASVDEGRRLVERG